MTTMPRASPGLHPWAAVAAVEVQVADSFGQPRGWSRRAGCTGGDEAGVR